MPSTVHTCLLSRRIGESHRIHIRPQFLRNPPSPQKNRDLTRVSPLRYAFSDFSGKIYLTQKLYWAPLLFTAFCLLVHSLCLCADFPVFFEKTKQLHSKHATYIGKNAILPQSPRAWRFQGSSISISVFLSINYIFSSLARTPLTPLLPASVTAHYLGLNDLARNSHWLPWSHCR